MIWENANETLQVHLDYTWIESHLKSPTN